MSGEFSAAGCVAHLTGVCGAAVGAAVASVAGLPCSVTEVPGSAVGAVVAGLVIAACVSVVGDCDAWLPRAPTTSATRTSKGQPPPDLSGRRRPRHGVPPGTAW